MPKYEVEVEITKTYVSNKTINVFAKDEDLAEEKAQEIVSGWQRGGADDVEIEVQSVIEM